MSDSTPRPSAQRRQITPVRIVVWIAVGGVGVFLLVSGIVGIIAKG